MKRLLYQLSYSAEMVVPARLERATARLSGVCSNQLSYETIYGGRGRIRTDNVYPMGNGLQPFARPLP